MGEYQRRQNQNDIFESALLVCGRKGKYQLTQEVTDMIRGLKGVPVMTVELSTHEAMTKIHNYTPKLNIDDTHRVSVAIGMFIVLCVCV
jgi:BioD-like phosphotransacetylase family protein